jgi:4-hydroxythreonine-4-phosphate dehydrogenase
MVLPQGDVLLQPEEGAILCARLANLVAECAGCAGGLVATGGETARAVLDRWEIQQLRLISEVEPGLPFSAAAHWRRELPILTKAGGFGRPDTLLRCRRFLQQLERRAAVTPAAGATK